MKVYRYFSRQYGETTVGLIKAENEEIARNILKEYYKNCDGFYETCKLRELNFDDIVEVYYGS